MTEREEDDMRREMNTLVAAYVLDALPADERSAFESYLDGAPDTAHEVAGLFATSALLGATNQAAPPPGLRARVLGQVAQTRQLPPLTGRPDATADLPLSGTGEMLLRRVSDVVEPIRAMPDAGRHVGAGPDDHAPGSTTVVPVDATAQRRRRLGARVAAAFALAAVVALGIVVGVQADQLSGARQQTQAALRRSAAISDVVNQPDIATRTTQVAGGGRATVLVSSSARRGVVVLDGVAALPPDKTYQLWLIDAANKARSVGTFGTEKQAAEVAFTGLRTGDQVGVSVEPAGGSASPTTKPVFAVSVA